MKLVLTGIEMYEQLKLTNYGDGTYTGSATKMLAVDTNGNVIEEPLPGGATQIGYRIDQTPDNGTYGLLSGTVNGSNAVFTVSYGSYISGTLAVYLNGQLQTQGASNDFQETTPSSGTFTFVTAPQTGDIVTVYYQTTESIPSGVEVQNEGVALTSHLASIDFVGAGVTATNSGDAVTVTIPGASADGNGIYTGSGTIASAAVATLTSTSTFTVDWSDAVDALVFTDSTKVIKMDGARVDIGGGTTAPTLRFWEPSGSGSNYVEFKATATTSNQTYTWPVAYPTATRALVSSDAGVLSWANVNSWSSIWAVNSDGNVQVIADQSADGLTFYSSDNSVRMVGDNAYGGFSDDAIEFRVAIDKLTTSLTSGAVAATDRLIIWDADAAANKYIEASQLKSYVADGNGIYSGSGTIASAAVATITSTSTFTIDYSDTTNALHINDSAGSAALNSVGAYKFTVAQTGIVLNNQAGCTVEFGANTLELKNSNNTGTSLLFYEPSTSGSNYTGFVAGTLNANQVYTLPSDAPNNLDVLTWNTGGTLSWEPRVTGPGTVTDNTIPLFNGTTGYAIDSSGVTLTTATDQFTITNGNASLIIDDNSGGAGALRFSISATGRPQVDVAGTPVDIVTRTESQTITSKLITPRITTTTSAASINIDGSADIWEVTALAVTLAIGDTVATSPVDGQKVILRIKDNGGSQTLSWDADFISIGVGTLPTATVAGKWMYFGMVYYNATADWHVVAYSVQA